MKQSKFQLKVQQATQKRKWERQANNRRAAWNRIGTRFGLSKADLDQAKKIDLSPHRVLRDQSLTTESVKAYIWQGRMFGQRQYESWADYSIDREIARLERLEDDFAY